MAEVSTVAAERVDFVEDVRPILEKHCYECHSGANQKSGLRLDIRSEAFRGGELYGVSIVEGEPDESPFYQFVADPDADLQMPPDPSEMTQEEVDTLRRWIEEGAVWPEGVDTASIGDPRDHWAFKPLQVHPLPDVQNDSWSRTDLDRFVLAKLESMNLSPVPEADRRTWLRRVTFDLHGLPPTVEELERFVSDNSEKAYDTVVERLLESPRYGERWAQHWLDVVRYADTHGFEVNTERPNAWPYRDYVIEAFNQDLPYDQFVRNQIAGDAMDAQAATGFLVTASVLLPDQIGKDEPSIRLARQDSLDEIVTNVGSTFLGMSVHCARCHNHKFDPISQREYYELQSLVAGVEYRDREFQVPLTVEQSQELVEWQLDHSKLLKEMIGFAPIADVAKHIDAPSSAAMRQMVNAKMNVDRFSPVRTQRLRFRIESSNQYEPCIDELEVYNVEGTNVALASNGAILTASGSRTIRNRHELRLANDGVYGNSSSWMSDEVGSGTLEVTFQESQTIDAVIWGRDREGKFSDRLATTYWIEVLDETGEWKTVAQSQTRTPYDSAVKTDALISTEDLSPSELSRWNEVQSQLMALSSRIQSRSSIQSVFAGVFREPDDIHLLGRGSPEMPLDRVRPAFPDILGRRELPQDATDLQRREALAEWIVDPNNPLTPRVMVNRVWQTHFGIGLVETANDFGRNGAEPTHPELLDWLSSEFISSGWSIKSLHRSIVLSATYRQASEYNEAAFELDADTRYLWRFPTRRLMGEEIRDTILMLGDRLNPAMGGPGFSLFDKRGGLTGFTPLEVFQEEGRKRMIYAHRVRRERDSVFGAFDCPDFGQSTSRRIQSTVSIQALNLFNSPFVLQECNEIAMKTVQGHASVPEQVQAVYEHFLLRPPSDSEQVEVIPFVQKHGLAALCRVLLNSNEFLFVR